MNIMRSNYISPDPIRYVPPDPIESVQATIVTKSGRMITTDVLYVGEQDINQNGEIEFRVRLSPLLGGLRPPVCPPEDPVRESEMSIEELLEMG